MRISELIEHSYLNRKEVERSNLCACFHCLARFSPSEIVLWTDSDDPDDEDPGSVRFDSEGYPGRTAICPKCGYDNVLGDACGESLSDDVLQTANSYWNQEKSKEHNK